MKSAPTLVSIDQCMVSTNQACAAGGGGDGEEQWWQCPIESQDANRWCGWGWVWIPYCLDGRVTRHEKKGGGLGRS